MSDTAPAVCDEAAQAIIRFEISSPAYYNQALDHPTWPGGASGVTIGIGYDLGYETEDQFRADWSALLPAYIMNQLAQACGRTGDAARQSAAYLRDLVIPLDAAMAVFTADVLPRYAAQTARCFPGCTNLAPLCFGALASLVYNRGDAMRDNSPDDRRLEMRQIRDAIAGGQPELVPGFLRSMKRLWPTSRGLRDRRDAEAAMFEKGMTG